MRAHIGKILALAGLCVLMMVYTYSHHTWGVKFRGGQRAHAMDHHTDMINNFKVGSGGAGGAGAGPPRGGGASMPAETTSPVSEPKPKPEPPATAGGSAAAPGEKDEIMWNALEEEQFELTDIGFPAKPLTIEEARLCDREMQPWLKGSLYSCKDPTCRACNKQDQRRKQKLIDVLRNEKNVKARHAQIDEAFKGKESITLMTVNTGQIHLFLNWVCSCDHHGIPVRDSTYMVPTDEKAAEIIRKNGFVALPLDWMNELGFKIDSGYEGADTSGWNPHMEGHSDINSVTIIVANDIIQKGYTLLLHDVDIVWKRDPRGWLKDAAQQRDLLAMFAPRWDALGVANSGFIWLKSNRRTKIFIQTLENLLPIKNISDQQLWNALIRHYRFRQIGFRVLPLPQFQLLYDHTLRRWDQVGSHAIVVHGVSHRKTYRLAKAKLWFFDETCDAYDKDLVPCNGDFFAPSCKI